MYYAVPDFHIKIDKKNQYEFYIKKTIFEVNKDYYFEGSALSRIDTKYNKFLFNINFENLKAIYIIKKIDRKINLLFVYQEIFEKV